MVDVVYQKEICKFFLPFLVCGQSKFPSAVTG